MNKKKNNLKTNKTEKENVTLIINTKSFFYYLSMKLNWFILDTLLFFF